MRKRLITLLLATMAFLPVAFVAAAPVVFADTQGVNCPADTSRAELFENASGDTSDGNDKLYVCSNITDLGNVAHTLAGFCQDGVPPGNASWDNCVSRVRLWAPATTRICLYGGTGYSGELLYSVLGPVNGLYVTLSGGDNDDLSSIRWTQSNC